jgi:chromosome partitioning protein
MSVIAIDNQKGGVGKTTLTFNLAKGFAARGKRTLVIDNDPQANLTGALLDTPGKLVANIIAIYEEQVQSIAPQQIDDHLYLIGADIHLAKIAERDFEVIYKLREGLERLKSDFDFVLIDCLPSFGFLNMAALNAADYVLIPTKPSPFALVGLKDLFDTIKKAQRWMNPNLKVLGIVLNLVEGKSTTLAKELEEVLRETYGALVFETRIRKTVKVEESPAFHQSIMEYQPNSTISKEFNHLIDAIFRRVGR